MLVPKVSGLFGEEGGLDRGRGTGFGGAFGGADDAEDFRVRDGGTGDEDAEAIAMKVGGGELDTAVEDIGELVGGDAFEFVAIAEGEFEPEAFDFGTAEEGLALGKVGLIEVADEVDGLGGRNGNGLVLTVGCKQVERAASSYGGGAHVPLSYSGVEEEDYNLFVCRR